MPDLTCDEGHYPKAQCTHGIYWVFCACAAVRGETLQEAYEEWEARNAPEETFELHEQDHMPGRI